MRCVFIHSKHCPKCEIFRFGSLITPKGIITDNIPERSPYEIIKQVCELVTIPLTEVDVSDEYELSNTPKLVKGVLRRGVIATNINKFWLGEVLSRGSIELPGFLILSNITKNRYVSVEIVTEAKSSEAIVISKWSAAKQCLRAMARTAIEERLIVTGMNPTPDLVEYLLQRLFPVDEEGEPNVWKWVRGFLHLRHVRVKR